MIKYRISQLRGKWPWCTLAKYTVCCVCPWPQCGANKLLTDLVGEFTGCPYNYTICLSVSLSVYVSLFLNIWWIDQSENPPNNHISRSWTHCRKASGESPYVHMAALCYRLKYKLCFNWLFYSSLCVLFFFSSEGRFGNIRRWRFIKVVWLEFYRHLKQVATTHGYTKMKNLISPRRGFFFI